MGEMIRLHNMVFHTKVLGPGTRTAIWLQGCHRHCDGCMSPNSRSLDGGKLFDTDEVIEAVLSLNDIEGITVSGGEPFLQIGALYYLLKTIKEKSDLGVIVYSGYRMDELRAMHIPEVTAIITELTDIIIDGEYVDALNDGKALKGSSNQVVNYISDRYLPYKALYEQGSRDAEVYATENEMFLVGVPAKETLEQWRNAANQLQEP